MMAPVALQEGDQRELDRGQAEAASKEAVSHCPRKGGRSHMKVAMGRYDGSSK